MTSRFSGAIGRQAAAGLLAMTSAGSVALRTGAGRQAPVWAEAETEAARRAMATAVARWRMDFLLGSPCRRSRLDSSRGSADAGAMDAPTQTLIDTRGAQMFPALTPAEVARLKRFGTPRHFRAGEHLARAGETGPRAGADPVRRGRDQPAASRAAASAAIVTHKAGLVHGRARAAFGAAVAGRRRGADRRSRRSRSRPSGCAPC